MVVDTLEPMDVSRRAYRLVGGVLVERTVGEVLPTVKANQEGIKQLLQQLGMTRANKEKEAAEWKVTCIRLYIHTYRLHDGILRVLRVPQAPGSPRCSLHVHENGRIGHE